MQQISTCPVGRLGTPLAVPKLFGSRPMTTPSNPAARNSSNTAARIGEPARHPPVSVGAQSASSQGALPETSRSFWSSVGGTIEFLLHAARVTLFAAAIVMTAIIGKPAVPEIQKVAPKSLDAVTLDSLRPCFTVAQQHFNARPEYTKVLLIAIASYLVVSATLGLLEMSSANKSQTRAVAQQVPVAASAPPPAPAAMPVAPAAADNMPAAAQKVPAAARKMSIAADKLPAWLSIAPPGRSAAGPDVDMEEEAPVTDIAATPEAPVAASAAAAPAAPQQQQPAAKPNPVPSAPALGRPVVVPSDAPRRKMPEEVMYRFGEGNSNEMTVFETNRGTVVISKDATNTTNSRRDAGALAGGAVGSSSSSGAGAAEPPAGPPPVAPSTPAKAAAAAPAGVPATDVAAAVAAHVKAGGSSTSSSSSAPSAAKAVAPAKVGNGNGNNGAKLMADEATSSSSASNTPAAEAAPTADTSSSSSSSTKAQNPSPTANVTPDTNKLASGKGSGKEKQNDPVVYAAALAWALFDSAAPKKGSKGKSSK